MNMVTMYTEKMVRNLNYKNQNISLNHIDPNDTASLRFKKATDVLKFWIDRLKKVSKFERNMARTRGGDQILITEDKSVQTENDTAIEKKISQTKKLKKRESTKMI